MSSPIAIVGMSCRYPDADSVEQLFENSLAQRRAFRRIPEVRLQGAGYFDESGKAPDRSYAQQAAVLKGFEFDRERFRVSKSSFEVTDLTHWLALTVAGETIDNIRFRKVGKEPDRRATRVVVGNTLTGEFSRSNLMRLRWPYVRGVVAQHLRDESPCLDDAEHARLLRELEVRYKQPFPVPNEDFLAGGLANTIAGRICNHFDFNGGGYSIDGACSSSLLAVTDACAALACGDADMALAGGVDLSLDPFELVGFSRTSALARNEMLVYDQHSEGFWPGEGCGFVALMRYADALEKCEKIHGVIHGWGISSDGKGGLTRPESEGQILALDRSYQRAGYGIESVGYFEGHGTGTKVGDAAELAAVINARTRSGKPINPAVISSIKANIGHTKAAAGLAGLLRATKCLDEQILPPTTACRQAHTIFEDQQDNLAVSAQASDWEPREIARRAGVSAMGFGGINTHLTVEEAPEPTRKTVAFGAIDGEARARLATFQDAELFLFGGGNRGEIVAVLAHVESFARDCSRAELTDLAVELAVRADREAGSNWKAAVVAATPVELGNRLELLRSAILEADGDCLKLVPADGFFLSSGGVRGKIGFVFPGQGAPAPADGGIHGRRFDKVREIQRRADLGSFDDPGLTDYRQAAITAASLCGLKMLQHIGAEGDVGIGHSLGELSALHWAGCFSGAELLKIARGRGRATVEDTDTSGAMVAIAAGREETVDAIGDQQNVFVANINSPQQTVVSGERGEIESLAAKLRREGVAATLLDVQQAFHTPAMDGISGRMKVMLEGIHFRQPERKMISTVSGSVLAAGTDLAAHLCEQLVSPVQFSTAVSQAAGEVDVFFEVGPGELMSNLVQRCCDIPIISIDACGRSLAPFLNAAAAAYVLGRASAINHLFTDRFARPFDWNWNPNFIQNPCEANPVEIDLMSDPVADPVPEQSPPSFTGDTLEGLRTLIADRTGLPSGALQDDSRMLSDLHLNSITVGEIVTQMATATGLQGPVDPTEYADASLAQIADALDHLAESGAGSQLAAALPGGVDTWVRYFESTRVSHKLNPGEVGGSVQGTWEFFGNIPQPITERLNNSPHGTGVIVGIGEDMGSDDLQALLEAAQNCAERGVQPGEVLRFVVIQHGCGASGFARSFFLEHSGIVTLVINLPSGASDPVAGSIVNEIDEAVQGFSEIFLGANRLREEARLRLVKPPRSAVDTPVIDAGDVVLVTGGGKGISAECGFQLARRTGCALLILGRSVPQKTPELATNLERLRKAGLNVSYQAVDVTDAAAVAAAVSKGVAELGSPVTGIVHGAGLNHPCTVANLSFGDLEATVSPKIDGLKNLLGAIQPDQLKLLTTFSSIIARIGLQGEADYALANEWLSHETAEFQSRHPNCRCRAIEWSVWSGTGMGQRLGRIDALLAQGISPIPIDAGVQEFLRLIDTADLPTRLIVSGRFGNPPTVAFDRSVVESLRFIDSIPVFYPEIELIAEWQLSVESDPYLDDHMLNGERLFPAVMALEAMTEAAVTLMQVDGKAHSPRFRDLKFRKAIIAPAEGQGGSVTLRLSALANPDGEISLAIRCSTTDFQVNHVEARCRLENANRELREDPEFQNLPAEKIKPFDPSQALYRNVLFQEGRFQRIEGYHLIEARRCSSQLSSDGTTRWFSSKLPQVCLLGDAGARDAALHAIQACIPHKIVIPIAVEEIEAGLLDAFQSYRMFAKEIADRGDELLYDLTIVNREGQAVERWRGITLRVMGDPPNLRLNSPPLVAPFFERRVAASMPAVDLRVSIAPATGGEKHRTPSSDAKHRPDGKPDPSGDGRFRSVAYSSDWKLEVDGANPLGCDLQSVAHKRPNEWASLLGKEGIKLAEIIGGITKEDFDVSATRVWTAREAMKKAGLATTASLVVNPDSSSQWVVLSSGTTEIYSSVIDAQARGEVICITAALSPMPEDAISPKIGGSAPPGRAFEYRHTVGFAETNVVGNVYYANHIAWQGRCREMFLKENCPEVIGQLSRGLVLATSRCSCEYLHELHAFDEIIIRMWLRAMGGNRVEMSFEYYKLSEGEDGESSETLAARGVQEIACMQVTNGTTKPTEIPAGMLRALESYRS